MVLLPRWIVPAIGHSAPHGESWITDDIGGVVESDILTCNHCQLTWRVIPGSGRKRGWCRHCNAPVCGKPACMTHCETVADKIATRDRLEERARQEGVPLLWLPPQVVAEVRNRG